MITLNLNTPEIKNKYINNIIFSKILDSCFLIASTLIIVILILYIAQVSLQSEHDKISDQIQAIQLKAVGQELEQLANETRDLNSILKSIDAAQAGYVNWFDYLQIMNETIPEGIQIDQISLMTENKNWQLKGRARNRDDLANFEKIFNNSDQFININFPIPDITLKENIPFHITGSFNN
jgi:Tfp pilus assembly protein PilN